MQRLREEDVQIYVIGFIGELDKEAGFIKKSPQAKAMALLNKFASETGGRAFFPQSISEASRDRQRHRARHANAVCGCL